MVGHKVTKNVEIHNDTGIAYISGREGVEGSKRFTIDSDTDFTEVQKLISGIWQPASFETGPHSLWIGKGVGIASLGHHIATESVDGHFHTLAHSEFKNGLSTTDTQILISYGFTERQLFQPDNTGTFTGTTLTFPYTSISHILSGKVYYQTDITAATEPVRIRIYQGVNDTGYLLFDQTYPASEFPASTEISLETLGEIEYETGQTYFLKYTSDANFSLKMEATNTVPWLAADFSAVREDNLLQTKPWVSGDSWNSGDYFIDSRKIYICNTTGVQSGTFAGNSALWDSVGDTGEHYWTKSGDILTYRLNGTDRFYSSPSVTKMNAGTGAGEVKADSNAAYLIKAFAYAKLSGDSFVVNAGSGDKFVIDNTGNHLVGNTDITGDLIVQGEGRTDCELFLKSTQWIADQDMVNIYLGLTTNYIQAEYSDGLKIGSDKAVNILYGANEVFQADSVWTRLFSPDGSTNIISITNGAIELSGPISLQDGLYELTVDDTNGLRFHWGVTPTHEMLQVNPTEVKLQNYQGDMKFSATEFVGAIHDGTRNRVEVIGLSTKIFGQDGKYSVRVDTDSVDLVANETSYITISGPTTGMQYYDGTRKRLDITSTYSKLVSPDGTNILDVNNTQTEITGELSTTGQLTVGSISGSLVLAPTSPNYGGGAMVIKGGGDGVGGFYSDWHMDHFWGDLRLYVQSTPTVQIEMNNIGAGGVQLGVGLSNTNIWANLDVDGSGTSGIGLQLRSGCNTGNAASQIVMSYDGLAYGQSGLAHSIKTRHNSTTELGNSMDFYLWDYGTDTANTLGTFKALSLDKTVATLEVPLVVNGNTEITGSVVKLSGLPTSDPVDAGALYNSSGTVKVSSG